MLKPSLLVLSLVTISFASAAASPTIEGTVRGVDGKPLKGAAVRLERKDKAAAPIVTATDSRGHYVVNGLALALYRISVVVDGAVKTAIDVKTAERSVPVDFDLKPTAGKKVKRMVWVPASTYSHIGGRWVEEGSEGSGDSANLDRKKAEAAQEWMRHQTNPKQFP